jgi:hypothetical protein
MYGFSTAAATTGLLVTTQEVVEPMFEKPESIGITLEVVREVLLQIWSEQACRNPAHWPETVERLTANGKMQRAIDACQVIAAAFTDGSPDDPYDVIWRAFPLLDAKHRARFVDRLLQVCRS